MNLKQRKIFCLFIPLTILIIFLDNLYPGAYLIRYLKLAAIIILFCISYLLPRSFPKQLIMKIALFFVVLGDALFVLNRAVRLCNMENTFSLLGVMGFAISYLLLIVVFYRRHSFRVYEVLALLSLVGILFSLFLNYYDLMTKPVLAVLILFSLILCTMTWSAICTIFAHYYTVKVAFFLALAGVLIFISDIGVGFAVFNPLYSGKFVVGLENVIWVAFISAWVLITAVVAEDLL